MFVATEITAVAVLVMTWHWVNTYLCAGKTSTECYSWDQAGSPGFNNHPVYMVASLIFCYSQAMMAYQYSPVSSHYYNKLLHFAIQTLAMILMCRGVYAAFYSHNYTTPNPIPHLYSLHSWVGISVVVLFATQYAGGLYHFLLPQDRGIPNVNRAGKKKFLSYHVYFGVGLFFFSIATCWLGFFEKNMFMNAKHIFGYMTSNKNGPNGGKNSQSLAPAYYYSNQICLLMLFLGIFATIAIARPKEVPPKNAALGERANSGDELEAIMNPDAGEEPREANNHAL
jgi:cytochrome b-561